MFLRAFGQAFAHGILTNVLRKRGKLVRIAHAAIVIPLFPHSSIVDPFSRKECEKPPLIS